MEGEKALWEEEEEKRIKQCEHPGLCFFLINATFYSYSVNLLINIWNRFDLNLLYASHLCVNVFTDISFQLPLSGRRIAVGANQRASIRSKRGDARSRRTNQKATCLLVSEGFWRPQCVSDKVLRHIITLLSVTTFICPLCLLRIQTTAPASSGPSPPRP